MNHARVVLIECRRSGVVSHIYMSSGLSLLWADIAPRYPQGMKRVNLRGLVSTIVLSYGQIREADAD